MPDTLLVTPTELVAFDAASQVSALSDAGFASSCIAYAQGVLQDVLGYDPFIHAVTQEIDPHGWYARRGNSYVVYPDSLPAVAVPAGSAFTIGGAALLFNGSWTTSVSYFAGYRRADQEVAGLIGDATYGLSLLPSNAAVPILPGALRTGLLTASLAVANRLRTGLPGVQTRVQDFGQETVTSTSGAFNDVNTLIGRDDEIRAILRGVAGPYRVVRV